jgi:ribosomal protein S18 acetylase RimI-like enzyme
MLVQEKIITLDSALFRRVDALYAGAFPWHEQRETPAKIRALSHPDYALEAWSDGEIFVGLSGSWTFDGYVYIEHLAIDGALRSRGYGRAVLERILARSPLTVLGDRSFDQRDRASAAALL